MNDSSSSKLEQHRLALRDGLALSLYRYTPCDTSAQGQPSPIRPRILVLHGFNDHAQRYVREMAQLHDWGYDVWAYDARGHGATAGQRGAIAYDEAFIDDLAEVFHHLCAQQTAAQSRPRILAHSMGALTAILAVLQEKITPAALVLTSPCLGVATSWWQKLQLNIGLKLMPDTVLPQKTVNRNLTARRPEVVERDLCDPLLFQGISPRLAAYLVQGGQRVEALLQHPARSSPVFAMPTLMMVALGDTVVDYQASLGLAESVHHQDGAQSTLTLKTYTDAYHELFNEPEPERNRIMHDLQTWLSDAETLVLAP